MEVNGSYFSYQLYTAIWKPNYTLERSGGMHAPLGNFSNFRSHTSVHSEPNVYTWKRASFGSSSQPELMELEIISPLAPLPAL